MRVGVTTSADRALALGRELHRHGLRPVALPCIHVEAAPDSLLEEARRAAGSADVVLVSSRRALEMLWPDGRVPAVPMATVGRATADRARSGGARIVEVGEGGMADLMARLDLAGATVVYPHAAGTDHLESLQAACGRLLGFPIYASVPLPPASDPVDAAAFASPSAVQGWTMARSLEDVVVAAIGDTTARALRGLGREPDVVPPRPSFPLLAQALAEHLGPPLPRDAQPPYGWSSVTQSRSLRPRDAQPPYGWSSVARRKRG